MAKIAVEPMIWHVAQEMAHELYDEVMLNNHLYAQWKAVCPALTPKILEARFVKLLAPKLIDQARATLVQMLTGGLPESVKDEIYGAILRDKSLSLGRGRAQAPKAILH